jgi:hypothetical protein
MPVVESETRTPTLPDDERTGELEPADARLRPQSPCSAASDRGVDPKQDNRGGSVLTSDPEYRHPLVPDGGGEQDEESLVVLPQAQESRSGMPSLWSGNECGLANMQPSAGQKRINLQHNFGHRLRQRHFDTD